MAILNQDDFDTVKDGIITDDMPQMPENRKLLNSFVNAWKVLRLARIKNFEDYLYLETMPPELKKIEFFIAMQPEVIDLPLIDIFSKCYTFGDWQPIPDNPYMELIERAKQGYFPYYVDDNKKFAALQLFAEASPPTANIPNVKDFYEFRSKVNHELLTDGAIKKGDPEDAKVQPLIVRNKTKNRSEVIIDTKFVWLDNENTAGMTLHGKMTGEDEAILNGAINLFIEALCRGEEPIFTINQIATKGMPGNNRTVKEEYKKKIIETIIKYNNLYCEINIADQLDKMGVNDNDLLDLFIESGFAPKIPTTHFAEQYFDVRFHFDDKTKKIEKIEFLSTPIVVYYAALSNQFLRIPTAYYKIYRIDKSGHITNSEKELTAKRKAIVNYLLKEIYIIKIDLQQATKKKQNADRRYKNADYMEKSITYYRHRKSDNILFESVYNYVGINIDGKDSKTETKRARDFCLICMENWKQRGIIKDYVTIKKGKSIAGMKISFTQEAL